MSSSRLDPGSPSRKLEEPDSPSKIPKKARFPLLPGNPNNTPGLQPLYPPSALSNDNRVVVGWKRVAWPQLRLLDTNRASEPLPIDVSRMATDIEVKAQDVLKKYQLYFENEPGDIEYEISLQMRQESKQPQTACPTLFILTPWSHDKKGAFKDAGQELVDYLVDFGRILEHQIHLDIRAPELVHTIYYGPVKDASLSETWSQVSDLVYQCLESIPTTRGRLTCLALQKYGTNKYLDLNPATIYISLSDGSRETEWYDVVAAVKATIDCFEGWRHVQVHIEQDTWNAGNDLYS